MFVWHQVVFSLLLCSSDVCFLLGFFLQYFYMSLFDYNIETTVVYNEPVCPTFG